jgi:NAD+ synthase (glutamine-hydrolysing)
MTEAIVTSRDLPGFVVHVEICEDLWVAVQPSTYAALGGATVLANVSASNITIGKADFRRMLCLSQSGRAIAGYVFTAAGVGESTTDLAWDGQALICENGELLVGRRALGARRAADRRRPGPRRDRRRARSAEQLRRLHPRPP